MPIDPVLQFSKIAEHFCTVDLNAAEVRANIHKHTITLTPVGGRGELEPGAGWVRDIRVDGGKGVLTVAGIPCPLPYPVQDIRLVLPGQLITVRDVSGVVHIDFDEIDPVFFESVVGRL